MTEEETDRLLERLIAALAAQSEHGLSPRALEQFEGLTRDQALTIFGMAGLDLHYGLEDAGLRTIIRAASDALRAESDEGAAFRPGDAVRVVGGLPPALADCDETWVRETTFTVRYVNGDGTVDIQPDLSEDYVIETVPAGSLVTVAV